MASQSQEIVHSPEAQLQKLNERVAELVTTGRKIEVTDVESCRQAKQFHIDVKSYEKAVDLYADGDILSARERLRNLQNAKKMLLDPLLQILEVVDAKRKAWEQEEREAAQREQADANKQREKKGLPPVEVKPSIPTMAGVRSTRNFYAEFTDWHKLIKAFVIACASKGHEAKERAKYFSQFIMPNEKALNAEARSVKDPKKLEKMIPGIRAWED